MATAPKTITKRDGKFVPFDQEKIRSAIERAWQHVSPAERRKCFGTFFDPWEKAPSNVPFLTAMTEYLESSQDRAENFR